MKTITPLALAVAIACCAAPSISAQQSTQISIDFKGGTLAEFLDQVRAKNDGVNIVFSPEAKSVTLPPLSIRKAGVLQTLRAVLGIVTTDCSVSVDVQSDRVSEPVHSVRVELRRPRTKPKQTPAKAQVRSQVFSLKFLTRARPDAPKAAGYPLETQAILMAVDSGLGVGGGVITAKIKYHEASGLLFVRGTTDQLNMVTNVLNELRRDMLEARATRGVRAKKKQAAPKKDG